jgi:hypothetical protein
MNTHHVEDNELREIHELLGVEAQVEFECEGFKQLGKIWFENLDQAQQDRVHSGVNLGPTWGQPGDIQWSV